MSGVLAIIVWPSVGMTIVPASSYVFHTHPFTRVRKHAQRESCLVVWLFGLIIVPVRAVVSHRPLHAPLLNEAFQRCGVVRPHCSPLSEWYLRPVRVLSFITQPLIRPLKKRSRVVSPWVVCSAGGKV